MIESFLNEDSAPGLQRGGHYSQAQAQDATGIQYRDARTQAEAQAQAQAQVHAQTQTESQAQAPQAKAQAPAVQPHANHELRPNDAAVDQVWLQSQLSAAREQHAVQVQEYKNLLEQSAAVVEAGALEGVSSVFASVDDHRVRYRMLAHNVLPQLRDVLVPLPPGHLETVLRTAFEISVSRVETLLRERFDSAKLNVVPDQAKVCCSTAH